MLVSSVQVIKRRVVCYQYRDHAINATAQTSKPKRAVKFTEVDLNEDMQSEASIDPKDSDEEEEEGDPSEFFDILDILDGRGDPVDDEDGTTNPPMDVNPASDAESEEDHEDECDDDDEEFKGISIDADDDEDAPEDALDSLNTFVNSLSASSKRKAEDVDTEKPRKRRSVLKERTEAGAENEFLASSAGMCFI